MPPDALVVDDDPTFQDAIASVVRAHGFQVTTTGTIAEARAAFTQFVPDLALLDLQLPDGNGLDLLRELEGKVGTDIILVTGNASVDSAVDALTHGAVDYLTKPIDVPRLRSVLVNIAQRRQMRDEIAALRTDLRALGHFGPMIGASPSMQAVYDLVQRVAPTDATVLLTGESGTGKELAARTVHQLSNRRRQPFVAVNCGAVSPTLIESELFGHERGSFTGAERMHKGYFERAAGGTLFLDEVTEMPIELQVRLLRVLETGALQRVGSERELDIDARVIAATNRAPADAVVEGKLREDLLYRLTVFPIRLPPLRERGSDIELLANYFLARMNERQGTTKRLRASALRKLMAHAWPGNVRELYNALQHAFILADGDIEGVGLQLTSSGAPATGPALASSTLHVRVGTTVDEAERRLILATLEEFGGNKEKSASVLGISLKTLYNKLNRYRGTG